MKPKSLNRLMLITAPLAGSLAWGCAGTPSPTGPSSLTLGTSSESNSPASEVVFAVIDGQAVNWESIRPHLIEAAGSLVLEEVALDRILDHTVARRDVTISETQVRAEEDALLEELARVGADQDRRALLDQVLRTRGLGPNRYDALLLRNARLRALIGTTGDPSDEEIRLAESLAFGPTKSIRLIVTATEQEASRARASIASSPNPPESAAQVASSISIHPSRSRGGLIEAFHADDPAFPSGLRSAIAELGPGEVSRVVATPSGFAVVLVESVHPPRLRTAGAEQQVRDRLRLRKQRVEMERLARSLLENARISPIDQDLARAWRDRG